MWRYNPTIRCELYHHGVKGQKWGVKNGPPYPIKRDTKPVEKLSKQDTIVKDAINSGSVSTKLNVGNQKKHMKETRSDDQRSYIDGDLDTAQRLINKLSGTGEAVMDRNGRWTHKERVADTDTVGTMVEYGTKEESKTDKAMIVYAKDGSHIYPRRG